MRRKPDFVRAAIELSGTHRPQNKLEQGTRAGEVDESRTEEKPGRKLVVVFVGAEKFRDPFSMSLAPDGHDRDGAPLLGLVAARKPRFEEAVCIDSHEPGFGAQKELKPIAPDEIALEDLGEDAKLLRA